MSFNMSLREAKQRCAVNNCYIYRNGRGDYCVGHNKWSAGKRAAFQFETDCIETAVIHSGKVKE